MAVLSSFLPAAHRCAGLLRAASCCRRGGSSRLVKAAHGLWFAVYLLFGQQDVRAQDAVSQEYQLKAVFLYNFVQFVEWPSDAFPTPETPITIGVFGKNPFGPYLQEAIAGEVVNGRTLTLRQLSQLDEIGTCHVLFVSPSETDRLDQILRAARGKSILTVGDIDMFAHRGGIINFIKVDNKVRYEINMDTARAARLQISSKLLRLATIIESGGGS